MPAGRPRIYDDPDEMEQAINDFFDSTAKKTVTGLAYALGFESRQSIYDYKENGKFSYIIKRALLQVEINYEEMLQGQTVTGPIFALKNMGWADAQILDNRHSGTIGNTYLLINNPANEPLRDEEDSR